MSLELVYRRADSILSFTLSSALGVHASGRLLFTGGDV
jgi:hypothetical protein